MTPSFDASNHLSGASSPYLLQHADNPVAWRPWGDEAFEEARRLDRPVFLSIGYSTCHWCHVMAHESFEDPDVARLLNEHFVPVKVDREERPDVDQVYMTACQMMTGRGGWPLTVVTTPDREPFFTGTYFPKEDRGRQPGLMRLLRRIAELWEEDRERVLDSAGDAVQALRRSARGSSADGGSGGGEADAGVLESAYRRLEGRFDEEEGGFGSAPKFPSPHNLLFLLRHADRTGRERAREMALHTLRAMRRGGVYDHVGYGFHRYATDARWLLPHFEKMLYDQAMLMVAYTEAWQVTGEAVFERTVREVARYLLRDMRDPAGGFHAAEDADSEGGEGAFYVWTEEELREVLGEEDAGLVREVWNTRGAGNFAEEATGRRTGENVLHMRRSLEEIAAQRGVDPGDLRDRLEDVRRRLFEAREDRRRPHRDDKVLTDWNGLAVAALAKAGSAQEEPAWVEAAREAGTFLLEEMRGPEGRLLHRWRGGEAGVAAFASDYAFLIWGLLELHAATREPAWLGEALRLQEEMEARCGDPDAGGYFLAPDGDRDLPVRPKELHDGALPSGNSVAAWNLLRLARLTGRTDLEERGLAAERAVGEGLERAPENFAMLLVAADFRLGEGHEVVLAGRPDDAEMAAMERVLRRGFFPRTVSLVRPTGEAEPPIVELAPFTREMDGLDGGPAAYVCTDFTCEAPVAGAEELRRRLEEGRDRRPEAGAP